MRSFQAHLLRNLRINRGFSLEMTARLIGLKSTNRVTRSAVSHWERGQARPSVEHLLALGETFQVPVDYFFDPLPKYLFGNVGTPHTRRGKPPLPNLEMMLEPAMLAAGLELPAADEPETPAPAPAPAPSAVGAADYSRPTVLGMGG